MKRCKIGGFIASAIVVMSPLSGHSQVSDPIFVEFDPTRFEDSARVTHELLPLEPGRKWVLEGTTIDDEGDKEIRRIEFYVTGLTKKIDGISTTVAYINDYSDGELVESEIAFYAQDKDGNVWYFGEYPEEYENEKFVAAKAWIHGFEDAKAGLSMKASPAVGEQSYYQGWGPAVGWSDFANVMELGQESCVPVACYKDVVVIHESNLTEKGAFQVKYYAPGVGNFRVGWTGNDAAQEELELVEFVTLDAGALAKLNARALALEKRAYEISDVYKQTAPAE
jgi:hypothetical protein